MTEQEHLDLGRPKFFNVDQYLDVVEAMINADEVERAFWMLDNMPGYYRDHVPERATKIRKSLHRQLFTPVQYQGIYKSVDLYNEAEAIQHWTGKAQVVEGIVRQYNEEGIAPNLMELAPGSMWLPTGLKAKGLKFTYEHKSIDHVSDVPFLIPEGKEPSIFVALEFIEHLWHESEIYENYLKFNKEAKHIVLSTPLYTCFGGLDHWEERPLGHLRTYTPKEFLETASRMFIGYKWNVFLETSIVLHGVRA